MERHRIETLGTYETEPDVKLKISQNISKANLINLSKKRDSIK